MTIDSVDAFVKAKVPARHQAIVATIRSIMRECAPDAAEAYSYKMPVWKANGIVAFMGSVEPDITLGFPRGTQFADRYKVLQGRGRVSRHIRFKTIDDVKKTVLSYYIRQSLKLDKK